MRAKAEPIPNRNMINPAKETYDPIEAIRFQPAKALLHVSSSSPISTSSLIWIKAVLLVLQVGVSPEWRR